MHYSWLQYYANFIQNFILLNIAQRDVCYTYGLFQHQNDVCAFEKNDEKLEILLEKIVVFELYSYALLCANNYLFHTHPHVFIRGKPQLLISK